MSDSILHKRLIDNLHKNGAILTHILQGIAQSDAATWRDGADGWTVLDVMCHLRDYEDIFRERGELMMGDSVPTFPVYDHLAMVVEREYHAQDLLSVLAEFVASGRKRPFSSPISPHQTGNVQVITWNKVFLQCAVSQHTSCGTIATTSNK